MIARFGAGLVLAVILLAAPAWALSDGDTGAAWVGAPTVQKTRVVNILSRELNVDPGKLQQCLDQNFSDPANANRPIREVARECAAS